MRDAESSAEPKLLIHPKLLAPLRSPDPVLCALCGVPRARLQYHVFEGEPGHLECRQTLFMCGLCFLYHSEWGKLRTVGVREVVDAYERDLGTLYLRDLAGRLLSCTDADALVAAIAVASEQFFIAAQDPLLRARLAQELASANGPQGSRGPSVSEKGGGDPSVA